MADKRLLEVLNESIGRELASITQYMWHHVMCVGLVSAEIQEIFKRIAIEEMKQAERFAERLDYLGGVPTTVPAEIKVRGDLKQMIRDDIALEEAAIEFYKHAIKLCQELDDPVTRLLYEEILTEEEDQHHLLSTLLGE